jgi:hypothetical protein
LADTDDDAVPIARFRAAGGALVAEADLSGRPHHDLDQLITRAQNLGADKLWLHAQVVDARFGFVRRGSYTRLEAATPPAAVELPYPPTAQIREIQRACFRDVWGRHDPGPPDEDSVFVALHEHGEWAGICEIDPAGQWIDGPGVVPQLRTPDRYARLVRGAAAYVLNEPVILETWGDEPETLAAYRSLGFEIVHSVSGWELDLGGSR